MKKLTHVEVEWVDAQSSLDIIPLSELEKSPIAITKSCGYLIKEDETLSDNSKKNDSEDN